MSEDLATGPLAGVRVVELAGIGPGPFAAMMLADLGADVIRVDRVAEVDASAFGTPHPDLLNRGRRSIGVDLKSADGREVVLALVGAADALIEGFRPGVTERLGVGPADCQAVNPALVYGRMTGWGQDGPNAPYAGHDIDYLALTGALHGIGRAGEPPVPPMNLLGDFGGGGMMLALGVVSALYAVRGGGTGQVVDAAVVDGVAVLSTQIHALHQLGMWRTPRGSTCSTAVRPSTTPTNAPTGGTSPSRTGATLLRRTGPAHRFPTPAGRADRPDRPGELAGVAGRLGAPVPHPYPGRVGALLTASDACAAPVLDWQEASEHPHLAARRTFVLRDGVVQPAPRPGSPPPRPRSVGRALAGEHTDEVLTEAGFDRNRVAQLRASGAVG